MAMESMLVDKPQIPTNHEKNYESLINNKYLTWDRVVQETLSLSGVSVFDRLDSPDFKLPKTSSANNLGHKTLRNFVCSSIDDYGMNMDWDNWVESAMAFRINKEIGVSADDAKTLIRDYNMVVKELGRKPSSANDFSRALNDVKTKSVELGKNRNRTELKVLASRVNNLLIDINYERASSIQHKNEVGALNGKMAEMKEDHIKQLSDQESRLNLEAEEKIKSLKIESEAEKQIIRDQSRDEIEILKKDHAAQISELRKEYECRIEELQAAHELKIQKVSDDFNLRINQLTEEITSLKGKYETGNYIEVHKYQELKVENANYANSIEKFEAQIGALKLDLTALASKIDEYEEEKKQNNILMGQLKNDIEQTESKIKKISSEKKRQEVIFQNDLRDIEIEYKNNQENESGNHKKEIASINQKRSDEQSAHQNSISVLKSEIKDIHENQFEVDKIHEEVDKVHQLQFSKILEKFQSGEEAHNESVNKIHLDYSDKNNLIKLKFNEEIEKKDKDHSIEMGLIRLEYKKTIDGLVKNHKEEKSIFDKKIQEKANSGTESLIKIEEDHVKQNKEFEVKLKKASEDYEGRLATSESLFKKQENQIKNMEKRLNHQSLERITVLEGQLKKYFTYLDTAKEKYNQLKFKHELLTGSQFEMTEEIDNLTLIRLKIEKKLSKQQKLIKTLKRIIRKCKMQAIIAIGVGVVVSVINWLMM